jgi:hypothetical protein
MLHFGRAGDGLAECKGVVAPKPLIFLHMGKTGGTTLSDVLVRNVPKAQRLRGWAIESNSALGHYRFSAIKECHDRLPHGKRRALALVNGHVPFGVHAIFEPHAKYITLVREPADRVVSAFYYMLTTPTEPRFYPHLKDMTLGEFVASDLCLDNSQVRVLSGCPDLEPPWDGQRPLICPPAKPEHLEAAKRNIEAHFLWAAPLDRIADLVVLLRLTFGWPLRKISFTPKNVTAERPQLSQLSADVRRAIDAKVHLDRQLYEWVADRFDRQVHDLGRTFSIERDAFEKMNASRSWWQRCVTTILESRGPGNRFPLDK